MNLSTSALLFDFGLVTTLVVVWNFGLFLGVRIPSVVVEKSIKVVWEVLVSIYVSWFALAVAVGISTEYAVLIAVIWSLAGGALFGLWLTERKNPKSVAEPLPGYVATQVLASILVMLFFALFEYEGSGSKQVYGQPLNVVLAVLVFPISLGMCIFVWFLEPMRKQ